MTENGHTFAGDACISCKKCIAICPTRALTLCGTEWDAKEVVNYAARDIPFYGNSGGITLSGGEPLMQKDVVSEIVKKLPDFDIALYTGHELNEVPDEILQNVNYVKTGPFVEKLKSSVTPFVGSTNQTFMKVNHAKM